jgi:hypothetical protein
MNNSRRKAEKSRLIARTKNVGKRGKVSKIKQSRLCEKVFEAKNKDE